MFPAFFPLLNASVLTTFYGPSQGLPICHGPSLLQEIRPSWSALAAVSLSIRHTPSFLSHPFLGSVRLHTIPHPTAQGPVAKEEEETLLAFPFGYLLILFFLLHVRLIISISYYSSAFLGRTS